MGRMSELAMDVPTYSECCGAKRDPRYETDFCGECKEHATFSPDEDEPVTPTPQGEA